jgi:site-specific recombinase XerD
LFRKGKSPGTVTQRLAALRFFYFKRLRRVWSLADTPYPKKTHRLPTVLSREEVAQLLHAARTPSERILLMSLYATGTRRSELIHDCRIRERRGYAFKPQLPSSATRP